MKKISLICCVVMLSGCSSLKFWESDEDKAVAPAELVKFEEEVELSKQWSNGAGSGQDPLYATLVPALANGVLYTADSEGQVYAIDGESGKVLWEAELDRPLSGGVGVGGGLVLVGDLRGRLFALDAGTGEQRWRTHVNSEILSAPAANDQVVVVQAQDARLLGLSATDGSVLWQYTTDSPALTLRGTSAPVMTDATVVTGFANGKIVALNPANGVVLWEDRVALPKGRTELERMVDVDAAPLLVGDVVYVTSFQGRAAAMSRGTGRGLWYQDISSHHQAAFGLDQVYISETGDKITALRANSGQVLWTNSEMTYRGLTSPIYVDGYLVVGDAEGYLHVLSPVDGRFVGRDKVNGSGISSTMVTDGKTLYVLANNGKVVAYRFEKP